MPRGDPGRTLSVFVGKVPAEPVTGLVWEVQHTGTGRESLILTHADVELGALYFASGASLPPPLPCSSARFHGFHGFSFPWIAWILVIMDSMDSLFHGLLVCLSAECWVLTARVLVCLSAECWVLGADLHV